MSSDFPEEAKEKIAFELIDMTGWAIQELYGASIPKEWKERVKKSFGISGKGRPTEVGIQLGYKNDAFETNPLKISYDREMKFLTECLEGATTTEDNDFNLENEYKERKRNILERRQAYPSITAIDKVSNECRHKIRPMMLKDLRKTYQTICNEYSKRGINPPEHIVKIRKTLGSHKTIDTQIYEWVFKGRELGISRSDADNYLINEISKIIKTKA